jgi:hypothetical protein
MRRTTHLIDREASTVSSHPGVGTAFCFPVKGGDVNSIG